MLSDQLSCCYCLLPPNLHAPNVYTSSPKVPCQSILHLYSGTWNAGNLNLGNNNDGSSNEGDNNRGDGHLGNNLSGPVPAPAPSS